ncbi:scavenger receptor cysteine-rich type 1 protein M130 isoform X2 [Pseudorasbora parva]|uniref:scavenger receptor cysteine-rich type 1 protein M130 isoform X2 n=1 Tax=Pseudorasbora parva TaxID=51549 RepID=UPI00351E471C
MLRPLLDFTLVFLNNYLVIGSENVKLVNGLDRCFGTVEVSYNGQLGTVCDKSWDMYNSILVCKQLGCGSAISAHGQALFGRGSGHVWLVHCLGNESSIEKCIHTNETECNHNNDVGVVCLASSVVIAGAVVTAVLLVSSTLLIIFIVRRRKKQKKIQICGSKDAVNVQDLFQNEENADDDYETVDMDDNSDSEQDYVNVNQDDSEQDYVNVIQDDINVETDDSEQDYVNVNITEHKSMLDKNYEDL